MASVAGAPCFDAIKPDSDQSWAVIRHWTLDTERGVEWAGNLNLNPELNLTAAGDWLLVPAGHVPPPGAPICVCRGKMENVLNSRSRSGERVHCRAVNNHGGPYCLLGPSPCQNCWIEFGCWLKDHNQRAVGIAKIHKAAQWLWSFQQCPYFPRFLNLKPLVSSIVVSRL